MNAQPTTDLEKLAEPNATAYGTGDYECLTELLDEKSRMRHTRGDIDNTGPAPVIQIIKDCTAILQDKGFREHPLIKQVSESTVVLRHVWGGTPLG